MFHKAIEDAQKVPGESSVGPDPLDLFTAGLPPAPTNPLVDPVAEPSTGMPRYNVEVQCNRFYVGRELIGIVDNTKEYADRDESEDLKAVLQLCADGKAFVTKRLDTILSDGSIVVWLEWSVLKAPEYIAPEDRDYMTAEELRSPKDVPRLGERKRAREAAAAAAATAAAAPPEVAAGAEEDDDEDAPEAEEGESHDEEEDW